jgi:hypothetical protein
MTHGGGRGAKIGQKSVTYYLNGPKGQQQGCQVKNSSFKEGQKTVRRND